MMKTITIKAMVTPPMTLAEIDRWSLIDISSVKLNPLAGNMIFSSSSMISLLFSREEEFSFR